MRNNGTLYLMLGDHLGSTSLTTNASGQIVSELRYKAWGEERYASGTTPTKYQYTGQFSYTSDFGLMYYGARWYDPALGRFNQPDTIIPQSQGVQAWDRYAYVNNNPVRYNDPTGHCPLCLTAVIGGAIGGIVGAVGYTAYVAATGREFNSTHFWRATGGGALAGALIGTGVGAAEGLTVAGATTAAVEAGTAMEGANLACGGDLCASEAQDAANVLGKTAPALENAVTQVGDDVADAASSYANKVLLQKSLASEAQLSEVGYNGRLIAMGEKIDDVQRLVSTYGGQAADWAKLSTTNSFKALDQMVFETHWHANKAIEAIVEIKTKIVHHPPYW